MTHKQYNEDELAAYLDQHLPAGSTENTIPAGESDPLVQAAARLSDAPPMKISGAARDRIRAQMLESLPAVPVSQPRTIRFPAALIAAAAAVVIFVIGVSLIIRPSGDNATVAILLTETHTEAAVSSATLSVTDSVTETTVPTTDASEGGTIDGGSGAAATDVETSAATPVVSGVTPSDEPPTQVPATEEPTPLPTVMPTVMPTVTPTNPDVVVLEGPIDAVQGRFIEVYGLTIELAEDDPLLELIEVEDFIRIEGDYMSVDGQIVIVAQLAELEITITEDEPDSGGDGSTGPIDVIISNEDGEVWRDNGGCDNPPPSWAPANGWRARCEGADRDNNGRGNGNNGRGNGN